MQLLMQQSLDLMPLCALFMSPVTTVRPHYPVPVVNDCCSSAMIEWCCARIRLGEDVTGPIKGNFNGCPPTYINAARCEILGKDSQALAERTRHDEVDVQFNRHPYTCHAWPLLFPLDVPESSEEIVNMVAFICKQAT